MCVHWYSAVQSSELNYHFFSKSKGRIVNALRVSFNLLDQSIFIWKVIVIVAFDMLHFVDSITKITWNEVHTFDCIFSSSLKTII